MQALIYGTIVQIKRKPNKMEATSRKVDNLNNHHNHLCYFSKNVEKHPLILY